MPFKWIVLFNSPLFLTALSGALSANGIGMLFTTLLWIIAAIWQQKLVEDYITERKGG